MESHFRIYNRIYTATMIKRYNEITKAKMTIGDNLSQLMSLTLRALISSINHQLCLSHYKHI
jgi:hypothetical protein